MTRKSWKQDSKVVCHIAFSAGEPASIFLFWDPKPWHYANYTGHGLSLLNSVLLLHFHKYNYICISRVNLNSAQLTMKFGYHTVYWDERVGSSGYTRMLYSPKKRSWSFEEGFSALHCLNFVCPLPLKILKQFKDSKDSDRVSMKYVLMYNLLYLLNNIGNIKEALWIEGVD